MGRKSAGLAPCRMTPSHPRTKDAVLNRFDDYPIHQTPQPIDVEYCLFRGLDLRCEEW
ncbi:hypothetical protein [Candidatus Poriferisodalis sp.]|uniref:hypothetical protein n=1 Tax=Candidatus Poriferisodalis sp. TaxID=3101277 RepID=UPI003B01EA9F